MAGGWSPSSTVPTPRRRGGIAVGVRPTSGIALAAGAASIRGGGLLVDDHMRTSLPDVYAAGDCIAPYHRVLRKPAFVPLGPAANKTGRVAGIVAAGGEASFKGILGTAVVKVYNLAVARTGLTLTEAEAEGLAATATDVIGKSRAKYYPGSSPVYVRLVHQDGGRILGAQMVGSDGVAKRIDCRRHGNPGGIRGGGPRSPRPLLRNALRSRLRADPARRPGRHAPAGPDHHCSSLNIWSGARAQQFVVRDLGWTNCDETPSLVSPCRVRLRRDNTDPAAFPAGKSHAGGEPAQPLG
jgi:hypothetical protein